MAQIQGVWVEPAAPRTRASATFGTAAVVAGGAAHGRADGQPLRQRLQRAGPAGLRAGRVPRGRAATPAFCSEAVRRSRLTICRRALVDRVPPSSRPPCSPSRCWRGCSGNAEDDVHGRRRRRSSTTGPAATRPPRPQGHDRRRTPPRPLLEQTGRRTSPTRAKLSATLGKVDRPGLDGHRRDWTATWDLAGRARLDATTATLRPAREDDDGVAGGRRADARAPRARRRVSTCVLARSLRRPRADHRRRGHAAVTPDRGGHRRGGAGAGDRPARASRPGSPACHGGRGGGGSSRTWEADTRGVRAGDRAAPGGLREGPGAVLGLPGTVFPTETRLLAPRAGLAARCWAGWARPRRR